MNDKPHVGFVDAHAEGDRGHHDDIVFALKALLMGAPGGGIHAGVIGQRRPSGVAQICGDSFHSGPRVAIDDAGLAAPGRQELLELAARLVPGTYLVVNVRPIEAGHEHRRVVERQAGEDLVAGARLRGCGEGDAWHPGVAAGEHPQTEVILAEVVAPFGNAVRLVDGKQRDAHPIEEGQRGILEQALGRDIQQIERAAGERRGCPRLRFG